MAQCGITDEEISGIQMLILLFFDVPLRHLPSSTADFVPRDQVMQRAYYGLFFYGLILESINYKF